MTFNAPFVYHTKTAEKLQKVASYATGAGVIVGVLAFFIALDDTGSAIAGLLISATVIVSAILAGGVAYAIFVIMEIVAKAANEDAVRAYRERQMGSEGDE